MNLRWENWRDLGCLGIGSGSSFGGSKQGKIDS